MESPPIPPPRQHKLENGKTRHTSENNLKTTKDDTSTPANVSPEPIKESPKENSILEKPRSSYCEGPDQIIPCTSYSTWLPDGVVKIKLSSEGPASSPPISIPTALAKAAEEFGDVTALASKNAEGEWIKINYREYHQQARTTAKAFLKLGLKRHHSVCIIGFNSAEWFISNIAAIHAGGVGVGIYTTNSSEACLHCINTSRADIILVEDEKQLNKILEIKSQCPDLKYIIQYNGTPKVAGVLSWNDLMNIGKDETDEALNEVLKTLAINECCTLVFTSGTVGFPKAVMLNHDNLLWNVKNFGDLKNVEYKKDIIVSYLPLSHIAAQCMDIYLPIVFGISVYFADREALKGTLVETLKEVRPTLFLGVPRVWEKIHEKMRYIGSQNGYIKRWIADWAKGYALQHYMDLLNGTPSNSFGYSIASMVIFKKIKQAIGLDRCRNILSGAAPLSPEIQKYFFSIDIPLLEAFGMSETTGPHTMSSLECFDLGTIGYSPEGYESKILNPDESGCGELIMRGRNVLMGYLNDEVKTRETIEDGWVHSGDVARINERGLVYITGRIKELIITAGGENVAPVLIEQNILAELPCLSQAVVIGDKRKFLSVLLTFKTETNLETGEPLDQIAPLALVWLKEIECSSSTLSELLANKEEIKIVNEEIQKGLDRANKKSISNAQKVQKFVIMPRDFSVTTGELGPTMKLKRNVISKMYDEIIENIYNES